MHIGLSLCVDCVVLGDRGVIRRMECVECLLCKATIGIVDECIYRAVDVGSIWMDEFQARGVVIHCPCNQVTNTGPVGGRPPYPLSSSLKG